MSKELSTELAAGPISIESYAENLNAKLQVAKIIMLSGMAPSHYRSPEAVLGAVLYGRELGFSPIRALHSINVINGKPVLSAEGLKALAIQNGGKIQTIEWTDKKCSLKCTRGDWIEECTFTWEDAQLQGLTNKDNWKRMPKAMLYARCVSTLVRNMFADVLGGLYSAEEMRDTEKQKGEGATTFQIVDEKTGEVIEDDLPESWGLKPADKLLTPLQLMKNAIEGEDLAYIASHKITTRCSLAGMSAGEAIRKDRGLVEEQLPNFNKLDQVALKAMLKLIPAEDDEDIEINLGE